MKSAAQQDIREISFQLLKEAFEGPAPQGASAFLNKGTGLFQTLDEISADAASKATRPEGSTVAAHTEHLRFYVVVHDKLMRGSTEEIDWAQSWRIKSVEPDEWDDLRRQCCHAYSTFIEHLRAVGNWGEDEISVATSVIAHTAYHLGAIRQLIVAQQPQS
jgi:hypothetical protein